MSGADAARTAHPASRGLWAEIGLLALVGTFLALIAPYGTDHHPLPMRLVYWIINIVGGGLVAIGLDAVMKRWIGRRWIGVLAVSAAMTPPVTALVIANAALLFGHNQGGPGYWWLLWQVFVIALPVVAIRELVWRPPKTVVESRTVVVPPLPEAEAEFRRRLSAKRRSARLIAVEAHDHYVRVHTDAGPELLTMRFADAMAELGRAHGFRVHRSWWVSADAVEAVRWNRASGEVQLADGLVAPISRSGVPALRDAGWL